MKNSFFLAVLAVLVLFAALNACMTPSSSSSSSSSSGGRISGVPNGVNAFLNQDDINKLKNDGLKVYLGSSPPSIAGTYDANSQQITYDDNGQAGEPRDEYHYRFYNQTAAGGITEDYEDVGGSSDTGSGIGAFISGVGNCFSVFVDMKGTADGCNYESPAIYSGCLTSEGIQGFAFGFIETKKTGSNCDNLVPVGNVRIITETDGLAEKITS